MQASREESALRRIYEIGEYCVLYIVVAQEVPAAQPLTEPCYCLNDGECVAVSENADNPTRVQCKCKQGEHSLPSTCSPTCISLVLLALLFLTSTF